MSDHTPGPWICQHTAKIRPHKDSKIFGIYANGGSGRIVAYGPAWTEEEQANARVLAAAPEMLDMLHRFVDKAADKWADIELIQDDAEALLAKIKGGE